VITNVPLDVTGVESAFAEVRQQLPGTVDLRTFVASHQVGVAKLATEYCSALVDDPKVQKWVAGLPAGRRVNTTVNASKVGSLSQFCATIGPRR